MNRDEMLGQVWMLNVWASWCATCRSEHPVIRRYAAQSGTPVLGLNYKDSLPEAKAWLQRFGDPYQAVLFDERGDTGIDFGVIAVPESFIIDKQGMIRYKQVGMVTDEVMATTIGPLVERLKAE